ncbi:unnamed protein product [Amoebophrya sp. A120]|nr:unnamed protein product [Amoebophrya sp. A120]|eukprot:GSA120T00014812001.1
MGPPLLPPRRTSSRPSRQLPTPRPCLWTAKRAGGCWMPIYFLVARPKSLRRKVLLVSIFLVPRRMISSWTMTMDKIETSCRRTNPLSRTWGGRRTRVKWVLLSSCSRPSCSIINRKYLILICHAKTKKGQGATKTWIAEINADLNRKRATVKDCLDRNLWRDITTGAATGSAKTTSSSNTSSALSFQTNNNNERLPIQAIMRLRGRKRII